MLQVRRAKESDQIGLFKLAVFMHRETDFSHFRFSPEKTLASIQHWMNSNLLLVAVKIRDGVEEVVGLFAASKRDMVISDDVVACEDVFYVREDYRGTRAAFLLVRGFMDWAREIGARHVMAGVSTGVGSAANRLYEHFGLRCVGSNFSAHIA